MLEGSNSGSKPVFIPVFSVVQRPLGFFGFCFPPKKKFQFSVRVEMGWFLAAQNGKVPWGDPTAT